MPSYPKPIGPYSAYKRIGRWYYLSGQIGIDPDTGELLEGIEAQTRRALTNIANVLAELGLTLDEVVKTTIYLKDMSHFKLVNEIYSSYFSSDEPPARSTVQVADLPKGALIEIEVVAYARTVKEDLELGLDLFLIGEFFASHEAWERAWRKTRGVLKRVIRGFIFLDAALIKLGEGNTEGFEVHIQRARDHLGSYIPLEDIPRDPRQAFEFLKPYVSEGVKSLIEVC